MMRRTFTLWHSLVGLAVLLGAEAFVLQGARLPEAAWLILFISALGALGTIYVATEVVEEVRGTPRMLALLFAVVIEFIFFFAVECWFLLRIEPSSFPTLAPDTVSLLLHSTMVFVFNPLYLPGDAIGRAFLLINTASALGLVLFILQNVWQLRKSTS